METPSRTPKASRAEGWMLFGILALGALLRFVQAGRFDLYHDEAINTFRAFGWYDFVGTDTAEMTPLNWFTTPPWWTHLSFHDHPVVGFAIQHVFMALFGDGLFSVRLPFILCGLLVTYLIYRLVLETYGRRGALAAALVFSISSFSVWTALGALYEGFVQLFSLLALLGVVLYTKDRRTRYLVLACAAVAAALATKYTALFLLPAIFLYFIIWHRPFFRDRLFYRDIGVGIIAFFVVLSPVLIYNANLYLARGHFDIHLSRIVGIYSDDFRIVVRPLPGSGLITGAENAQQLATIVFTTSSLPFILLLLIATYYMGVRSFKKKEEALGQLSFLSILWLMFLFLFLPPENRYVTVLLPFFAIAVGIAVSALEERAGGRIGLRTGIVLALVILLELAYSCNTNVLSQPVGPASITYSDSRYYAFGFEQLDSWIHGLYGTNLTRYQLTTFADLTVPAEMWKGKPVVFYDDSMLWSAWLWHVFRFQAYYKLPLVAMGYVERSGNGLAFMQAILANSASDGYFVRVVDPHLRDAIVDADVQRSHYTSSFEDALISLGVPHQDIVNGEGQPVFRVYEIKKGDVNYLDRLVIAHGP